MSDPITRALAIAAGRFADSGDLDDLGQRLESVLAMVRGDGTLPNLEVERREPGAPAVKRAASTATRVELAVIAGRVFAYWREATGHERARQTPERVRCVIARIKQGYTEGEIRLAIDGCVASEFHGGGNDRGQKYDELTLICRSGSHLEKFIDIAPGEVDDDADPVESAEVVTLKQRLRAARDEGNQDEYSRINAELREARARASA